MSISQTQKSHLPMWTGRETKKMIRIVPFVCALLPRIYWCQRDEKSITADDVETQFALLAGKTNCRFLKMTQLNIVSATNASGKSQTQTSQSEINCTSLTKSVTSKKNLKSNKF